MNPGQDARKSRQHSKAVLGLWGQIIQGSHPPEFQRAHLAPGRPISNCLCPCVMEHCVLGSAKFGAPNFLLCVTLGGLISLSDCFYICRNDHHRTILGLSHLSGSYESLMKGCRGSGDKPQSETKSLARGLISLSERWGNNDTKVSRLVRNN